MFALLNTKTSVTIYCFNIDTRACPQCLAQKCILNTKHNIQWFFKTRMLCLVLMLHFCAKHCERRLLCLVLRLHFFLFFVGRIEGQMFLCRALWTRSQVITFVSRLLFTPGTHGVFIFVDKCMSVFHIRVWQGLAVL